MRLLVDDVIGTREMFPGELDEVGRIARCYLSGVVFPIFLRHRGRHGPEALAMGSGFYLQVDNAVVLVTAAHIFSVQRHAPVDIGVGRPGVRNTADNVLWIPECDVHLVGGEDDGNGLDVAITRVPMDAVRSAGREAVPMSMLGLGDLLPLEPVLVHGFPFDLATVQHHGDEWSACPVSLTYVTHAVGVDDWPPEYRQGQHHLLHYERENACQLETNGRCDGLLPKPGGLSGCGVWSFREDEGLFSYRNLRLHGVQYAIRGRSTLICNSSLVLASLVGLSFPDLRPAIERLTGPLPEAPMDDRRAP